jgi:hypothetical protein
MNCISDRINYPLLEAAAKELYFSYLNVPEERNLPITDFSLIRTSTTAFWTEFDCNDRVFTVFILHELA